MILPGFVKDCLHKIRLGIGIAIPIMLEGLPQGELQRLVSLGFIGVSAQVVPEDDLLPLAQVGQVQVEDLLRKAFLGIALVVAAAAVASGHAPVTRMDKRFMGKMFHMRGKALAKIIRAQMHPDDILFYYRSTDDDSGVVLKRSRVKAVELVDRKDDELQLTLPLHQIPI